MRNLNNRQWIVLGVGLLLSVVNCLFPPYRGEINRVTHHPNCYIGYRFVLHPPDKEDAYRGFNKGADWTGEGPIDDTYSAHLIISQWFIQSGVIVLVTLGTLVLAATRKETNDAE